MFKLRSPFQLAGDQAAAVSALARQRPGKSTLMGVTGSGKTHTLAHVIAERAKPTIILAPNKTLAAQLYEEFSQFFPENKVSYFVSYYDYYQPESYVPARDLYIPKEAKVNAEIERLRLDATVSILTRPDSIVIASVSSIYSLGDPREYRAAARIVRVGDEWTSACFVESLESLGYREGLYERHSGTYHRVSNGVEVTIPYAKERIRFVLEGGSLRRIERLRPLDDTPLEVMHEFALFPARHFMIEPARIQRATESIRAELEGWLPRMKSPLCRERLRLRVEDDIARLLDEAYCPGIENYSLHFDGRSVDEPPFCLFDFFKDPLVVLDESHLMVPQLQGMYAGDRMRKERLVEYGFRLPSAFGNRPLRFEEVERYFSDVIFVSATPGAYELSVSDCVVEQVIRPTGLIDPIVEVAPREGQIDRLVSEIISTRAQGYRSLVLVLTKKMAEELALFLEQKKISVCYLHSDLKTPQRTEILHKLRAGVFDCVVGVNLLREGLDLPEVALVAIMDADIEGFLRDKRSLIQMIGRAARNVFAKVLMFADGITSSMREALDETKRRRALQSAHNEREGIVPRSVERAVTKSIAPIQRAIMRAATGESRAKLRILKKLSESELAAHMVVLREQMQLAAKAHDYDSAIQLREELFACSTLARAKSPTSTRSAAD